MRFYKYIFIIIFIFWFLDNSLAQKSNVFYEYKYLELTNIQGDIDVIKDNYRNAELVSDSIIINRNDNYINAHFYYELANAYKLGNNYEMCAFSLLRQLILFPNDSLKNGGIQSFVDACYNINIDNQTAVKIYKTGALGPTSKNKTARLELLIEQAIELYNNDIDKILSKYIYQYKKTSKTTSLKIKQWEFLRAINLDLASRKEIINNYYNSDIKNVFNNNPKLKKKLESKVKKYNKKHNLLYSFDELFLHKT